MKRAIGIVMVFFLIFSLSACGQVSENGNQTEPSSSGSLQTELLIQWALSKARRNKREQLHRWKRAKP